MHKNNELMVKKKIMIVIFVSQYKHDFLSFIQLHPKISEKVK